MNKVEQLTTSRKKTLPSKTIYFLNKIERELKQKSPKDVDIIMQVLKHAIVCKNRTSFDEKHHLTHYINNDAVSLPYRDDIVVKVSRPLHCLLHIVTAYINALFVGYLTEKDSKYYTECWEELNYFATSNETTITTNNNVRHRHQHICVDSNLYATYYLTAKALVKDLDIYLVIG